MSAFFPLSQETAAPLAIEDWWKEYTSEEAMTERPHYYDELYPQSEENIRWEIEVACQLPCDVEGCEQRATKIMTPQDPVTGYIFPYSLCDEHFARDSKLLKTVDGKIYDPGEARR